MGVGEKSFKSWFWTEQSFLSLRLEVRLNALTISLGLLLTVPLSLSDLGHDESFRIIVLSEPMKVAVWKWHFPFLKCFAEEVLTSSTPEISSNFQSKPSWKYKNNLRCGSSLCLFFQFYLKGKTSCENSVTYLWSKLCFHWHKVSLVTPLRVTVCWAVWNWSFTDAQYCSSPLDWTEGYSLRI